MGLFRTRAPALPLEMPKTFQIPLPTAAVVKKRALLEESTEASEAAAALVEQQPDWLVELAKTVGSRLVQAVGWHARSEKESIVLGLTIGLGAALSSVEQSLGWQQPGSVDARIHTALAFAPTDFPKDLKDIHLLLSFGLRAGYWAARTGEEGLSALLSQDDLRELVNADQE